MCGLKQSFTRLYFESEKASDCREAVQQMSMKVKEMDDWKANAILSSIDAEQKWPAGEIETSDRQLPRNSSLIINSGNEMKRHCADRESPISLVANKQSPVMATSGGSKWAKYGRNDNNSDDDY